MTEHHPKYFSRMHQRCHAEAEQKANDRWPGGLAALIADYRAGHVTLQQITNTTGIQFRGVRRLFQRHGVEMFDCHTANAIAHKLRPAWGANITKTKLRKPFYHPRNIIDSATVKRLATIRADPSRHGLAHMRMSNRERQFADMLETHGIVYRFNQPAARYFLDFHLPDISVGVEVQRSATRPDFLRDSIVRKTLGLSAILYVPTQTMRNGHAEAIERMVAGLLVNPPDLAELGDCRFFTVRRDKVQQSLRGFGFMRRWIPAPD